MPATIDFGIDLGTTNSSIVSCINGKVHIYQSTELMNVTPSVVYVGRSGRMLVGKRAYDAWIADPQNTQAEFKRWMGFSDKLEFSASGRTMSAEELSAEVLKALRADVARSAGVDVTASVITVPAAFGSLQCDATGKAARLAGLSEAPLLQEPIAAAIAYGASAAGKSQRWMVFDLGGGTLDIAIVSTRHGRLAVLEHQGDNRLGGKDIDRLLAENILLPALAGQYALPDRTRQPREFDRLFRNLLRVAEQAKIALSTSLSASVDIFGIGNDTAGKPIEAALTITRGELERQVEPLFGRCIALCQRALEGARVAPADLDRLILVGGPTQMPMLRSALAAAVSTKLDFSIDPMTVVAQGAALYASTLERTAVSADAAASTPAAPRGAVEIRLNHERASGTPQSPVAGVATSTNLAEVKIDAEGGFWSSGWLALRQGRFAAEVTLDHRQPVTRYVLSGRDARGNALKVSPVEFAIAYMLPMAAPPLPHTIAIELTNADGRSAFDPIFARHSPLPAEARRTYRAERTLRPSELDATLPIKFWEIDVSEDPQEKWWAGCVHVRAEKIRRPLMEGSDLELVIKIDTSRKVTVEVFIPAHNQGFSDDVFVPDPPSTRNQLQQQLDVCFERVDRVFQTLYAAGRDDLRERVEAIQLKLEVIAEQVSEEQARGNTDPDAFLGPNETLRKVRVMLAQLEEQLESERGLSPLVIEIRAEARWTVRVVQEHGTQADKDALERLSGQLDRYIEADDHRGLKFVKESMRELRATILWVQPWYWEGSLAWLKQPGRRFLNDTQARQWMAKADAASERRDLPALRDAVGHLWEMQPPNQVEAAKEQAMQSGLKGR